MSNTEILNRGRKKIKKYRVKHCKISFRRTIIKDGIGNMFTQIIHMPFNAERFIFLNYPIKPGNVELFGIE